MRGVTKLEMVGLGLQAITMLLFLVFGGGGGFFVVVMLGIPLWALVEAIRRRRIAEEGRVATTHGITGQRKPDRSDYEEIAQEIGGAALSWWRNRRNKTELAKDNDEESSK